MKTWDPIHASGPYVPSTMHVFARPPRLGLVLARLTRPDPLTIHLDPRLRISRGVTTGFPSSSARGNRPRLRVRQRVGARL